MRTGCWWVCVPLITNFTMGCVEVNLVQRTEGQSVELSCSLEQFEGRVRGLHLYHSSAHKQVTTVLSMVDGSGLRVSQDYEGRLQVTGVGLDWSQVRVLLSPLRSTDSGRYVWEFTYRAHNSSDSELIDNSDQQLLLLVEGRRCQCSSSYPLLLYVVSAAAGTLVVTLLWLTAAECARARKPHNKTPTPAPIYEEMTAEQRGPEASRKQQQQQGAGRPQNNPEGPEGGPSHLEEAVYANPTNFYACPRRLAERL